MLWISRSGLTQDIKMGTCLYTSVTFTSIDNTATGWPCVCILRWGGVSFPVSTAWHSCMVKVLLLQAGTVPICKQLKPKQTITLTVTLDVNH